MAQISQGLLSKLPTIGKEALEAIQIGVADGHPIAYLEQLKVGGVTCVGQRLINLLEEQGVSTLADLMQRNKQQLLGFENFGEKQLILLFKALSVYHQLDINED